MFLFNFGNIHFFCVNIHIVKALKLLFKPNSLPLLVVIFFGLLASKGLIGPGYFNMHDDLQMMRQLEMEKCFQDLQIPCRWVPDMGYGFGFPLFNFYPPLPYLVGHLFRVIGFSFVDIPKILFTIAFVGSGVTMYFLSKEFFGKIGGILSSVFYLWAPYHAVDIYVRGAMNEAWALIWFPSIFLFSYKLISNNYKNLSAAKFAVLGLSLFWFGLLTSHNLMVLIFTPVFALWCLIHLFFNKKNLIGKIINLSISGIFAFGLAAFFTLPVFLEQKLVHADTLVKGYFEYVAHFASIDQILFSRFWGYGPSVWMDIDDKMSFQIGHLHWILPLVVFAILIYRFIKLKKVNSLHVILYFMFLIGWVAAFMTHPKSVFLWKAVPPLQFVQFPWRFLTLVIFCFSFVIGSFTKLLSSKLVPAFSLIAIIFVVIFNWEYFKVEGGKLGSLTDEQKFSGAAWDLQRTAGIYDYLPKTAKENPKDGQNGLAEVILGKATISNQLQKTNRASFTVKASGDSEIRINIYQFPNWKTFIDGKEVENYISPDEMWGRMYIKVPQGSHEVTVMLYDTPVRSVGNIISLFSWGILALILLRNRNTLSKRG